MACLNNRNYEADIPGNLVQSIYNVIDYGAKPNDTIDDTIFIQKASDLAKAAGGVHGVFPCRDIFSNKIEDRTRKYLFRRKRHHQTAQHDSLWDPDV